MRTPLNAILLLTSAIVAASAASAAPLILPDDNQAFYSAYVSQPIERPWETHFPEPRLVERPIAEVMATKLGMAEGSAQLFRFRLENAPSNATVLKGQIVGGGIRLKLSW